MERIDVFDPKGKGCSDAAWEKLPSAFRLFVQGVQMRIQNEVEKENPGEFRPTSGFRSIPGNFPVTIVKSCWRMPWHRQAKKDVLPAICLGELASEC